MNDLLRCYEVFRDGAVAFEREGQLCFGPASKLSAFLSGSGESFLLGEAARSKIDEHHAQQRPTRSKPGLASETDGLALTRRRWLAERSKGQWTPEFVQKLLAQGGDSYPATPHCKNP
jgi:hypothetical protein